MITKTQIKEKAHKDKFYLTYNDTFTNSVEVHRLKIKKGILQAEIAKFMQTLNKFKDFEIARNEEVYLGHQREEMIQLRKELKEEIEKVKVVDGKCKVLEEEIRKIRR